MIERGHGKTAARVAETLHGVQPMTGAFGAIGSATSLQAVTGLRNPPQGGKTSQEANKGESR